MNVAKSVLLCAVFAMVVTTNETAKGDDGYIGEAGPKGRPGRPGQPGYKGGPGPIGDPGNLGYRGPPGFPGCENEAEHHAALWSGIEDAKQQLEEALIDPNSVGNPGPVGPKGQPGVPGPPGMYGAKGSKGQMGNVGRPGPLGYDGRDCDADGNHHRKLTEALEDLQEQLSIAEAEYNETW